ncbi:3-phosphoshikimate 1-carboxyvinyltransferase [Filobacillus milosensis]|uniref:3-phosphoshikimate 1-carboxyvinyltransferase n=1 Tax=Filobacillus milosensis TaxID=94137 RepID=A0A4Y8IT52_9BACI|nr:3-phosphoshikimate 1-carboxyvinyltransferase [Filobacillus milosensis]
MIKTINQGLTGKIKVPGDKSISHRSIMLGALADGDTYITNFLDSEDCMRTVEAFKALGSDIKVAGSIVEIKGKGVKELKKPSGPLNMGNSGTTARLLSGILSGLPFNATIIGDDSLSNRPMDRIIEPLNQMGATIESKNNRLPMTIHGDQLHPIEYKLPIDSAQVKSAVLLAGLLTSGHTTVIENNETRDHTERMLPLFGGKVNRENKRISIKGNQHLHGAKIKIPGDISSASFWIAGAVITPGSDITISDVGLNPTRIGFINVLKRMNANISMKVTRYEGDEPIGNIHVQYSQLQSTTIEEQEVASFIDEVPLLALVATQINGSVKIEHIEELKYKESNRIQTTVQALNALNVNAKEIENGILIEGQSKLIGNEIQTYGDHRIAMMACVASFISEGDIILDDTDCINISYPNFLDELHRINNNL